MSTIPVWVDVMFIVLALCIVGGAGYTFWEINRKGGKE